MAPPGAELGVLLCYFHWKTLEFKYSNFICALSSDSEKLDHQMLHNLIQSEFKTDGDDFFFLLWECFKYKCLVSPQFCRTKPNKKSCK